MLKIELRSLTSVEVNFAFPAFFSISAVNFNAFPLVDCQKNLVLEKLWSALLVNIPSKRLL